MEHITKIHLLWHGWELKSVPKQDLRPHTARTFISIMERYYPRAWASIQFDEEQVKGAELTLEATGEGPEHDQAIQEAYDKIYRIVRKMMHAYIASDARHRAEFLVKPRVDQLRYGVLN